MCRDCQHFGIRQTQHVKQNRRKSSLELFMVAVNAKYSISVKEVPRIVIEQHPRVAALINNLNEEAAERKMVSVLFLSLRLAARKSLTDKAHEICPT